MGVARQRRSGGRLRSAGERMGRSAHALVRRARRARPDGVGGADRSGRSCVGAAPRVQSAQQAGGRSDRSSVLVVALMPPLAPLIVLTIHNPQVDLQKLRPALEWIGRAEPMLQPERIERWSKQNLGIDKPFDPSSLAKRGLDPKAPIQLTFPELA